MKKGEPGHEEATAKWHETVTKKYGSVSILMQRVGSIGGKNGKGPDYKGGFAGNHERARIAGTKGGRASKRTSVYQVIMDRNKEKIKDDYYNHIPMTVIAKDIGVPYQSVCHYIKKNNFKRWQISK